MYKFARIPHGTAVGAVGVPLVHGKGRAVAAGVAHIFAAGYA